MSTQSKIAKSTKRRRAGTNSGNIALRKNFVQLALQDTSPDCTPVIDFDDDILMGESSSLNGVTGKSSDHVWLQDENFENNLRTDFSISYDFDAEDDNVEAFVASEEVESDSFANVEVPLPANPTSENFTIRNVIVPENAFNTVQTYSIRLLKICEEMGISSNAHKAIVKFFNEAHSDEMFYELLTACPYCKSPKSEATPWRVLRMADKFAQLLACKDIRERLEYRHNNYPNDEVLKNRNKVDKVYNDIFDGDVYANVVQQGLMENKHDICIKIDIDGFKSKFSSLKMVIVHCRFNKSCTFPIAVIYGTRKPDLNSYLRPIIKELAKLTRKPLLVQRNGEYITTSRIVPLTVCGDGVQINQLMNFGGHGSFYGCRLCLTLGSHRVDAVDSDGNAINCTTGMYFQNRTADLRTYESLIHTENDPEYIRNAYYGIKLPSVFSPLVAFKSVSFHSLDEMHLVTNVAKTIFELISTRYNKSYKYAGNEKEYPFEISTNGFAAIEQSIDNFEAWFITIDRLIADKKISNAIYKINFHQLSHIVYIIKENSTLRVTSVRSMERSIGITKKSMRARVNAGENSNNIFERNTLLSFIEDTKMLNFEGVEKTVGDKSHTFMYHPSRDESNRDTICQLWQPFYTCFNLFGDDNNTLVGENSLSLYSFIKALKGYKKRHFGITSPVNSIELDYTQVIKPAGKMWQDSKVFSSSIFTNRLSKSMNKRGGEYVMFNSFHRNANNVVKKAWFAGKVLFFFEFNFNHVKKNGQTSPGSFYAVMEVMKKHGAAKHNPSIPVVTPFGADETKKYLLMLI
ncbi:hypothetical protein ABG067_007666 [Albugo candida]